MTTKTADALGPHLHPLRSLKPVAPPALVMCGQCEDQDTHTHTDGGIYCPVCGWEPVGQVAPEDIPAGGLTMGVLLTLHSALEDALQLSWATVPVLPMATGVEIQENLRGARARVGVTIHALRLHELEEEGWRRVGVAGIWVRMVGKVGQCPDGKTIRYETMEANGGNGLPVEDTFRELDLSTVTDPTIRSAITLAIVRSGAEVDGARRPG